MPEAVTILAIESSCDETAAAVMSNGLLRSSVIASQLEHEGYGGVIPELASRAHVRKIIPVVKEALSLSSILIHELDAVAYTAGPGLIGSLMVGSSFAKALALSLEIPLISVHHMQAHVFALYLDPPPPPFPFLCLTVSGGHTQLVLVKDYLDMQVVGETLDDAAGEAFDKSAKLLGLPYPGGPLIDRYASAGNPDAFRFPEPQIAGFDFSFSGLKTAILYFIREQEKINPSFVQENLPDLCASIQKRIATILIHKLEHAALHLGLNRIALAGGVSANSMLRKEAAYMAQRHQFSLFIPPLKFCTDNAAMVAAAGYHKLLKRQYETLTTVPEARLGWQRSPGNT